jgi:hypothetical protein
MNKNRPHMSREDMKKQHDEKWMVGVWNKIDQRIVKFKDGTVYGTDEKTGVVRRLTPKPYTGKAGRRAKIKQRRLEREARTNS